MTGLNERTAGLTARLPENPRRLQEVTAVLVDGCQLRGILHRTPGTRTLDFLNHQAESFIAFTDATLTRGDDLEFVSFVAINKAHIIRLGEALD
jgi:hypothetical protein